MEALEFRSRIEPTCHLSDPSKPHKLCRRTDPPLSVCSACKGDNLEGSKYYYYCATCSLEFHRGCHLFPPQIIHPFHSSHPLTLISTDPDFQISNLAHLWNDKENDSEDEDVDDDDDDASISQKNGGKCKCCWRPLNPAYYHCSICNFSLNLTCTMHPPQLTIEHPTSHEHTLTFLPRRIPLPCDACGLLLNDIRDLVYTCIPCSYMVHQTCIYLPRVIKLTRHQHRLSLTSSPSAIDLLCGVCFQSVDSNCGQYSCNKGCPYAVHSRCATKDYVWDGKDLQGVPEEHVEEIEPFVRIDEVTIQHFTHHHRLILQCNESYSNEENKYCEACVLPIMISESFYSCVQCEFILHDGCACLPRRKNHPIHKHPLLLQNPFSPGNHELQSKEYDQGVFDCHVCRQSRCGFVYKCGEEGCGIRIDVRCASIPNPLTHGSRPHDHPLFISFSYGHGGDCMTCKTPIYSRTVLECVKKKYFLCLRCATIPCVVHYKYDRHPLTICFLEEATTELQYWCEICESRIDTTAWFYTCDHCKVTLHIYCLVGKGLYLKPHHRVKRGSREFEIIRNGNSRPFCWVCREASLQTIGDLKPHHRVNGRCIGSLILKSGDKYCCAFHCL